LSSNLLIPTPSLRFSESRLRTTGHTTSSGQEDEPEDPSSFRDPGLPCAR
jgi:hypothetical protein